ncbi:MAG: Uncharacterized protein XD50_0595 [Clostridia bacterium 41_269]|nr:MAG: Uncharacterized protein XD50_0595 [Clostridia bacterium 41_269]
MNFRDKGNEINPGENGSTKMENEEKLSPEVEEVFTSKGKENNMDFLETIYGVIFTPRSAFKFIGMKKPMFWSVGLFICIFLFNFIISMWGVYQEFHPLERMPSFSLGFLVLGMIFVFAAWFLNTAVINLISQFFGGNGNGIGLFAAFAFAEIPLAVTGIFAAGAYFFGLQGYVAQFFQLLGGIWSVVLQVIAVSEVQELSLSRAVLVCILPLAAVFCAVLLLLGTFLFTIAPLLRSLPNTLFPIL